MQTNRLFGQTALITGATSGIGKACAIALDHLGVKLILTGRSQEKLDAATKDLQNRPESLVLDVRDRAAVEGMLSDRPIDILINNAGLALGLEPIDGGSLDQWEEMIDANIKGLLTVSRAVIGGMRARDRGHIINLGSIAGEMVYPGGNVYCATKHAVHALSKAMNLDLNGTAIRVSNVAPGAVETAFSKTRFGGDGDRAEAVYAGYEPLRAEDIADLILYILNAPAHVNIQETLIMPTAQRNPYIHYRKESS